MLNFVIPLRDESTTDDWPGVCVLLERTLESACAQTGAACRAVVVGHRRPEGIRWPENAEFVPVSFPPPKLPPQCAPDRRIWLLHTDKGRKLLHGLAAARELSDAYVMFLDADDLVSNRLAQWTNRNAGANGWYFDRGYRLDEYPRPALYWRRRFYHECGSSYILRAAVAPFPNRLDDTLDLSDYYVRRYVTHAYIRDDMSRRGVPLSALPFYGAIYTFNRRNFFATQHREPDSNWRRWLRHLLKRRPITPALRREFALRPAARLSGSP